MKNDVRTNCISSMYELYPLCRKLVFDTFDKQDYGITRTQQTILLALSIDDNLSMSQLAARINTSNEQTTRAVAQLVEKEYVKRVQNTSNRRIINIHLTQLAKDFVQDTKAGVLEDLLNKFDSVSDEDMDNFNCAIHQIIKTLKQVEL